MSQAINLKEADSRLQGLVEALCSSNEMCEVKDERGRTIAAVLPASRYASYQAYLRRRAQHFAVLDRLAEKMKGYSPDFIEAQVEKAVNEVKSEARARRQDV